MEADRLLRLADRVEFEIGRGEYDFDLKEWGLGGCGTAACAIGLAVATGMFEAEGFTRRFEPRVHSLCPKYGDADAWQAVNAFFGLTFNESISLFDEHSYVEKGLPTDGPDGARTVVAAIRNYVAAQQALMSPPIITEKELADAV